MGVAFFGLAVHSKRTSEESVHDMESHYLIVGCMIGDFYGDRVVKIVGFV